MSKQEIKKSINSLSPCMRFIGAFVNYNELRRSAEKKAGNVAVVGPKQMQYVYDGKHWRKLYNPTMPKIMFDEHFGLQSAVIDGRKTMTRRVIPDKLLLDALAFGGRGIGRSNDYLIKHSRYHVGDRVAIAQSYESIVAEHPSDDYGNYYLNQFRDTKGWCNKMFVRSDMMPHHILIKKVSVERLQDISDRDCLREGVYAHTVDLDETPGVHPYTDYAYDARLGSNIKRWWFCTPREAFAELIRKMSGRNVWDQNPWVFVYEFELEKQLL